MEQVSILITDLLAQHPTCNRLVITGGEPLLQQHSLVKLLRQLPSSLYVEVETNATISPTQELVLRINQWNISPKLAHSGLSHSSTQAEAQHAAIKGFATLPHAWFKFVINCPTDEAEIAQVQALITAHGIAPDNIILMPCASTQQQLHQRSPAVAQLALAHGYRFSSRLHIALWGDTPGV